MVLSGQPPPPQKKNPGSATAIYCATYCMAVVALNVSSVSTKMFDSFIALCVTRHVLSNTIALFHMLKRENDNLIQVTKEVGVVVTV